MSPTPALTSIRPPAVAGLFYAGTPRALRRELDDALAQARPASLPAPPKALIVPHAGYVYSGPIAATAYACLDAVRGHVRRVVLLGPCHRVAVRGLALPRAEAFETPLGTVPLDQGAMRALAGLPQVVLSDAAHAHEHSLEVQLPFLQTRLGEFALVPLAVGDASAAEVAEVIERLWGGDETLVVVSSDLSHYHRYDDARSIDAATVRAILAGDSGLDHEQACGATPIAGLLEVARRRGLVPQLLDLRNSGDTAGDRARVVGYAAIAFCPPAASGGDDGDAARGRTLLALARGAIEEALGSSRGGVAAEAWLREHGATFVTLHAGAALRGCIGSLEPYRALGDDVAANAVAAALRDPRFPPVRRHELDALTVEVSLLGPSEPIAFRDRSDLAAQLRPGDDGVILECGTRRATFLPQVWDALPDPGEFLDELARKAGIARIDVCCRAQRYRVRKWSESGLP
ncbi:MAG: AmmeMemoRadiSam system protein B [Betaproteobacteria bacterium]|jgi:AmmeMemoRadiSam system protein B/AmmeMemoRadiSam system protein A|nr:AmmeMemoRadiSam system protein B [Betaproteobacteria bacterium]